MFLLHPKRLRSYVTLLCLSLAPCAAAEKTWIEIKSPHFRVLTDSSAQDARNVANQFEQIRHVLVLRFKTENIDSSDPLTIIAARDETTFRDLEPLVWKNSHGQVAGEFHRGWEKQFAVIRLDTWTGENQVVVYHEYTHSILHANAHWLPVWLDEGLAEFYGYTRFESSRTLIGAPSQRMGVLKTHTLLPVTTMLDVTQRSPYYHDEDKMQLFYAESWAMVHFMIFGPGMENGEKLIHFFRLLQDGTPQQKAFQDAFGDPHQFDKDLSKYLAEFTLQAGVLPGDQRIDPKTFAERKLTPAETDYELGCFHIGAHDAKTGRTLIEKALELDPKLAGAHEELGFLNFREGHDEDAQKEWKQAVDLDPTRHRSLFALTMSGTPLPSQTPDQLRDTQHTLRHITELAPDFAPAYVELALVEWRLGSMQQAYKDAKRAEALEPWRAGYHILTGRVLLNGKQPALAATYARYVAGHWFGPDHNEAVDLWEDVPAPSRGDGPALAPDLPAGVTIARGTLTSLTCATNPGGKLSITFTPIAPDAKPLTFSSEGRFMVGFSDTFWWGEDHYTLCHHLTGHPAVLAYKSDSGQLLDLEVRDDLPPTGEAQAPKAQTTASTPAQP